MIPTVGDLDRPERLGVMDVCGSGRLGNRALEKVRDLVEGGRLKGVLMVVETEDIGMGGQDWMEWGFAQRRVSQEATRHYCYVGAGEPGRQWSPMKEGMEAWARAWEAELSLSGLRCRWGGRAEILEREYWATVDCVEDVMAGQSGEGRRFYGLWDRWRKGRLEKTGMGKESRKAVEEEITGMVIQYLEERRKDTRNKSC